MTDIAQRRFRKNTIYFFAHLFLLFVLFIIALSIGGGELDFAILSAFFDDSQDGLILTQLRLPRSLAAIVCGGLLGISGAVMQGILRNPLASPYTLGIAQAAGFGASFAIIVLGALQNENNAWGNFGIVASSFVSSMLCMFGILYLGKIAKMSTTTLILAGVAMGAFFHACTMGLQYIASELEVAAAVFWTFGDLTKASMQNVLILSLILALSLFVFLPNHWKLDALSFGDDNAQTRGVNVGLLRTVILLFASLASAAAVSYFGIIGFIGLVGAHLVRLTIAQNYAIIIPFSVLTGAILLLIGDIISRIIIAPLVLPIGIVTAFMGVPLFLYLLAKSKVK